MTELKYEHRILYGLLISTLLFLMTYWLDLAPLYTEQNQLEKSVELAKSSLNELDKCEILPDNNTGYPIESFLALLETQRLSLVSFKEKPAGYVNTTLKVLEIEGEPNKLSDFLMLIVQTRVNVIKNFNYELPKSGKTPHLKLELYFAPLQKEPNLLAPVKIGAIVFGNSQIDFIQHSSGNIEVRSVH